MRTDHLTDSQLKPLIWSAEYPTTPGWYKIKYYGYKSRRKIENFINVRLKPENVAWPGKMLAIRSVDRNGEHWQELRYPESCKVKFAGPIPEPLDEKPA